MTVTQSPQQHSTGMVTGKVALVTGGTRGIGAAVGTRPGRGGRIDRGWLLAWARGGGEVPRRPSRTSTRSSGSRCTRATSAGR